MKCFLCAVVAIALMATEADAQGPAGYPFAPQQYYQPPQVQYGQQVWGGSTGPQYGGGMAPAWQPNSGVPRQPDFYHYHEHVVQPQVQYQQPVQRCQTYPTYYYPTQQCQQPCYYYSNPCSRWGWGLGW